MRKWGFSAALVLVPLVALFITVRATGFGRPQPEPTPSLAPLTGAEAPTLTPTAFSTGLPPAGSAGGSPANGARTAAPARITRRSPAAAPARQAALLAEEALAGYARVSSPTPELHLGALASSAAAIFQPEPLAIPERVFAPTIRLDTSIVPVGWKEVKDKNGEARLEWIVASYQAGWHKNSALPGQGGNIVLAAHNNMEGEIFRYIEYLKPGDPVFLYAGGKEYKYRVTEGFAVREKGASEAQRRENARWIGEFAEERLTLISCWPYTGDTHRMFVIAHPWE